MRCRAEENRIVAALESAELLTLSILATREGESVRGRGETREVCTGEKRVRRRYGIGCPLGETFNRLVANAFKMAGLVRSALIAAERGYVIADELLRHDLWIPWDVLP